MCLARPAVGEQVANATTGVRAIADTVPVENWELQQWKKHVLNVRMVMEQIIQRCCVKNAHMVLMEPVGCVIIARMVPLDLRKGLKP